MKSLTKPTAIFPIAGLLIVAFTQILAHFITLPDFLRGAVTGIGIGMELIAVIKLLSSRRSNRLSTENQ